MPLTEALVNSLGPAVWLSLPLGSRCMFLVSKLWAFTQPVSWLRVVLPVA